MPELFSSLGRNFSENELCNDSFVLLCASRVYLDDCCTVLYFTAKGHHASQIKLGMLGSITA